MESHVRMEVLIIFFMGTLLQASVSSAVHCPVRAKPWEDIKSSRDAYNKWIKETFEPCGVSALEMKAKESSLDIMEIRGGDEAKPRKWPWHVLVYSTLAPAICGGTLISSTWVVTAAHCVVFFPMNRVWAGIHDRSKDRGQKRAVSSIISHRYFSQAHFNTDIALLKLAQPLYFNNSTWPACLPSQSETFGQEECYVTGYGATATSAGTNVLKELKVSIMERAECEHFFHRDAQVIVDESMFCSVLGLTGSTWNDGICAGDSGGPLVCRKNHRWTLVGITSSGTGCLSKVTPDQFTNVSHFRGWIDRKMLTN